MTPKPLKRPILLLEVMIALAIIVICIIPLLQPHLFVIRYERDFIEKVELDHIVNLLYVEILTRLYLNKIDWRDIEQERVLPIDRQLLDSIEIGELPFTGTYQFKVMQAKPKSPKPFMAYEIGLNFTFTTSKKTAPKIRIRDNENYVYHYQLCLVRDLAVETPSEAPVKTGKEGSS